MKKTPIKWEDGWGDIMIAVNKRVAAVEGQDQLTNSHDFMNVYTTIYNLCCQGPPFMYQQELYDGYKETLTAYITQIVLPALQGKQDMFFLRDFNKRWSNYKILVKWLSGIFNYLDHFLIPKNSLPTLNEVGQTCFHDLVYNETKDRAKDVILAQIHKERDGEQIDRASLKNVVSLFLDIGINYDLYENEFEAFMLEDTANYYSQKASKHILKDSFPEYMLMVEECLEREKNRVSHYLHSTSEPKLLEKTRHALLFLQAKQLLEKEHTGLQVLLRDSKVEDLSRMYRLFSKIDKGLEPASFIFKEHVTSCALALVKDATNAASQKKAQKKDIGLQEQVFVSKVIELHDKYFSYITNYFMGHFIFCKAFRHAFEDFFNKDIDENSKAEILATYCDIILKGGGIEKLSDEAIKQKLEKIVELLVYFHQKDLFAEFCRKKLACRLLSDKNANSEHEWYFLTKLKQQFGVHIMSKMEGMITDLTLAHNTQVEFEKYLMDKPHEIRGTDLSVIVITTGFWPTYKSLDFNIPAELISCIEVFKSFYESKTKHRKLTWLFSLGNCNVIGRFQPMSIELQISVYQAATLLLFNVSNRLTFVEIMRELNLPDEEVKRILYSLSCGKYKVLIKEPNTKVISQTDNFEFNSMFTDNMKMIKVPLPLIEEKKKVVNDVARDRKYAIDAAIVRIMKSRKILSHQQLVMECLDILNDFKPDVRMIKCRIEILIEQDYLERDVENNQLYRYLA